MPLMRRSTSAILISVQFYPGEIDFAFGLRCEKSSKCDFVKSQLEIWGIGSKKRKFLMRMSMEDVGGSKKNPNYRCKSIVGMLLMKTGKIWNLPKIAFFSLNVNAKTRPSFHGSVGVR
jgi:hypothetical protein